MTDALREILGQPVLVENRAGAGGNVGADSVAKAVPDGLTLRLAAPGPPELRRWRSWWRSSWRWAKREPGGLAFGPSGNGRSNQLAGKLLKAQAGIDTIHASCRGAAPAMTDPVGGQLRGFQLRGGQVQGFEATGATRAEVLPWPGPRCGRGGAQPGTRLGAAFGRVLVTERAKWGRVVAASGAMVN